MSKEERYAIWNRYYQKHKTEINARRKIVRESYKNKLSEAENKIVELEKENANLKEVIEGYKKIVKWCDKCDKLADLEEELKHAEENCINKTCVVFKDKEDCVAKLLELEKENKELKCECRRCVYTDSPCILSDYGKDKNGICDYFKDVFEELQNWKDEWQEQVQKATDEGYARTLQTIQLTKAKEIIKKLISDNRKVWVYSDVREEAEQFLSEVEK